MDSEKITKAAVVEVENREEWDLVKDSVEMFKTAEWQDVFILAALLGFKNGTKKPWSSKRNYLFRRESIRSRNWDIAQAITVAESGSIEVLQDTPAIIHILEDYANAGIKLLKQETADRDVDYAKKLEALVRSEVVKM